MPIHETDELDKLQQAIERGRVGPFRVLVEVESLRDFHELSAQGAKDFVDWNKHVIMKELLEMIAEVFDNDIAPYVRMLRRLGAEWQELDILEQSITKGHLREDDDGDYSTYRITTAYRTKYIADHEQDILNAFRHNVLRGINRLSFFSIKADEIPYVEDILEDNKEQIMKLLLTYLREGDMTDYGTAKGIIIKLQDAGVAWPELDIALRSILKAFDDDDKNHD